ncbi:hypothetical protein [Leifsonia aquatica]|uniref:hypothetical protein n=1 Tax=Leifsonia aquatica TaxID=144185 RepID=UPI003828C876
MTIAVATYGYGGTKHSFTVTVLGMGAVLVFAALDAMYLREERRFRKLFQAAASGAVSVFDMDARGFCKTLTKKQQKTVRIPNVIRSWSILNYYGVIFLAGLALLVWIIYFTKR